MTNNEPEQTRDYEDELIRAWDLLEEGDPDAAETRLARVPAAARDSDPDAVALAGHIAAARGDYDAAKAALIRAGELDPEASAYLVHAARIELEVHGDAARAIALCDQALAQLVDDEDLAAAVIVKADAMLEQGASEDDARALLRELDSCEIGDPDLACRAGELLFGLGDLDGSLRAFGDALAADPDVADAHYGVGAVHAARGELAPAVTAWLRARELDLQEPPADWHLSVDEFERIAERALAELPRDVIDRLENVPLLIEDVPSVEMVETGLDPRLLGLFSGTPLPDKSHVAGQVPSVDTIHLYQRNLERMCDSPDQLAEEIRVTVLHETAHFFGLDDDHLDDIGLG